MPRSCRLTVAGLAPMLFAILAPAGTPARAGGLANDSLLSAPGDTSLAPPALVQGGVVSQSFGSDGIRSSSVRLDSGLLGGSTRAFLELGAGQGPSLHGRPVISGSDVAVGVETALPYGVTLGVEAGAERDRFGGQNEAIRSFRQ